MSSVDVLSVHSDDDDDNSEHEEEEEEEEECLSAPDDYDHDEDEDIPADYGTENPIEKIESLCPWEMDMRGIKLTPSTRFSAKSLFTQKGSSVFQKISKHCANSDEFADLFESATRWLIVELLARMNMSPHSELLSHVCDGDRVVLSRFIKCGNLCDDYLSWQSELRKTALHFLETPPKSIYAQWADAYNIRADDMFSVERLTQKLDAVHDNDPYTSSDTLRLRREETAEFYAQYVQALASDPKGAAIISSFRKGNNNNNADPDNKRRTSTPPGLNIPGIIDAIKRATAKTIKEAPTERKTAVRREVDQLDSPGNSPESHASYVFSTLFTKSIAIPFDLVPCTLDSGETRCCFMTGQIIQPKESCYILIIPNIVNNSPTYHYIASKWKSEDNFTDNVATSPFFRVIVDMNTRTRKQLSKSASSFVKQSKAAIANRRWNPQREAEAFLNREAEGSGDEDDNKEDDDKDNKYVYDDFVVMDDDESDDDSEEEEEVNRRRRSRLRKLKDIEENNKKRKRENSGNSKSSSNKKKKSLLAPIYDDDDDDILSLPIARKMSSSTSPSRSESIAEDEITPLDGNTSIVCVKPGSHELPKGDTIVIGSAYTIAVADMLRYPFLDDDARYEKLVLATTALKYMDEFNWQEVYTQIFDACLADSTDNKLLLMFIHLLHALYIPVDLLTGKIPESTMKEFLRTRPNRVHVDHTKAGFVPLMPWTATTPTLKAGVALERFMNEAVRFIGRKKVKDFHIGPVITPELIVRRVTECGAHILVRAFFGPAGPWIPPALSTIRSRLLKEEKEITQHDYPQEGEITV